LLQNQIQTLKTSLEAQGIQVDRLSVVLAGSPDSASGFNQNNSQQHSFQQHPDSSRDGGGQQQFSRDGQNPNSFASQLNHGAFQQSRQGFAHHPAASGYTGPVNGGPELSMDTSQLEPSPVVHDQGRISVLA
jgi:hypothetical protein